MKNIVIKNIRLPFTAVPEEALNLAKKRLNSSDIKFSNLLIYKKSIDARKKNNITFLYSVLAQTEDITDNKLKAIDADILKNEPIGVQYGNEKMASRPVVCGFGPAGMFCALMLAEHGYAPIVCERGSDVHTRRKKVDEFYKSGILDNDTNIQFGAGGAGTFSDGKLVTRINDSKCRYVLERLKELGAPDEVLVNAKPHIGTDKLFNVVSNLTQKVISLGGTVLFDTRVEAINIKNNTVYSVETNQGEIPCGALIMAIGHSARDTYAYIKEKGFHITPKPFSVGVRIEHLREDIDRAMFGEHAGNKLLGAAEYQLSHHVKERGVYTFCMCPGGEVVAAASEQGGVVVNGMSEYNRDGINSNSAIAVSVTSDDPIEYQRRLEQLAFQMGGQNFAAPVQTVGDFLEGKISSEPKRVMPTYMNGKYKMCDLNEIFTKDISDMLKLGIKAFDGKIQGFAVKDAVLTGVETRTSAPVRIIRDENYLALSHDNIYPCGEGAGYAGGITSAAVDGINVALAVMRKYKRIIN